MYDIALLPQDKRDELFTETANKKNITKSIVEKDFWVVWTIAKIFKKEKCTVDTIVAPRTFWEKATILHHEANRPDNIPMPTRYSRHYYDLSLMAQSEFKDIALADTKLLENVVEFKQKLYPRKWAKYEDAKAGTLKLLPPKFRYTELKKDYKAMQGMIFGEAPKFDEIMDILGILEDKINNYMEKIKLFI